METTFNRPVRATLHVHLENGETWEATHEDLDQFNLVDRHEAYMVFNKALTKILRDARLIDGNDITDTQLNAVRYLVEIAITSPHLLWHAENEGWRSVADLERALQLRAKLLLDTEAG